MKIERCSYIDRYIFMYVHIYFKFCTLLLACNNAISFYIIKIIYKIIYIWGRSNVELEKYSCENSSKYEDALFKDSEDDYNIRILDNLKMEME